MVFQSEHFRRRRTTADMSGLRPHSRLTETLHSGRRTPDADGTHRAGTPNAVVADRVPSRAVTPAPHADFDNDFDYGVEPPPRFPSRTPPVSAFADIEYVEPVPLPKGMEHLLSPPRAVPLEFMNSTAQSPVKELGCKFTESDLYLVILQRCADEKKLVFEFAEFANNWSRPFIAKQFHNFLSMLKCFLLFYHYKVFFSVLMHQRKIIGRAESGIFKSFLITPTKEFKTRMIQIRCKN